MMKTATFVACVAVLCVSTSAQEPPRFDPAKYGKPRIALHVEQPKEVLFGGPGRVGPWGGRIFNGPFLGRPRYGYAPRTFGGYRYGYGGGFSFGGFRGGGGFG